MTDIYGLASTFSSGHCPCGSLCGLAGSLHSLCLVGSRAVSKKDAEQRGSASPDEEASEHFAVVRNYGWTIKVAESTHDDIKLIGYLLRKTEPVVTLTRKLRDRYGLNLEEAIIYLAVGQLSISVDGSVPCLRPVSHIELATYLAVPRETVRRKAHRLTDQKMLLRVPHGLFLKDVQLWIQISKLLLEGESNQALESNFNQEHV